MRFWVLLFFSAVCFTAGSQPLFDKQLLPLLDSTQKPFYFGIASGDPQADKVIIWTKVWPDELKPVKVKYEVASDTALQNVVDAGVVTTDSSSAYTVKLNAKGLKPHTTYFYRFEYAGQFSPIGRTKTAPVNSDSLKFAVVSCQHYEQGYYNAYGIIANQPDLDAVIHLGDYIYEYGAYAQKGKHSVRPHVPDHEIVSLQDYRTRYAQYRCDKDLQEAHRLFPFITEWDDHEFANDAYKEGAKNHQSNEGPWEAREANAKKAYFEWIPITDNVKNSVIRKINYGGLAELFMLDTRVEARCIQVNSPQDTMLSCVTRTILGKEQTEWLTAGVEKSKARWKILANQVVFSELDAHQLSKKHAMNPDAWDGYPEERKEIMDSFYQHNVKNVLVITGDIHLSWAFDLVENPKDKNRYDRKTGKGVIGAEFVTPSISTNGIGEKFPHGLAKIIGSIVKRNSTNPHLRFQNLIDHGFVLLNLNKERANATWYFCKTVMKHSLKYNAKHSYSTQYDNNRLVRQK